LVRIRIIQQTACRLKDRKRMKTDKLMDMDSDGKGGRQIDQADEKRD